MSLNIQVFNNLLTGMIVKLLAPVGLKSPGFPFSPLIPFGPGVPFSPCLLTPGFPYSNR